MIELFSDPTMINVNFIDATVIGNDGNPVEGTSVSSVPPGCILRTFPGRSSAWVSKSLGVLAYDRGLWRKAA